MLVFSMNIFGQVGGVHNIPTEQRKQLDKIGVDDSTLLNSYESDFLNEVFKDSLKDFDFTWKKIGFFKGGNTESSKTDYFNMHKKHFSDEKSPCDNGYLYIFDEAAKKETGGYDAIIVYWTKFVVPKEKILKRLTKRKDAKMRNSSCRF